MLATAATLSASAATVELLTNGDGSTLNGWTVSSGNFSIQTDGSGVSWVASGGYYNVAYQTVTLADFGFSASDIANNPTMTASVTVWAENSNNRICNARVFQLDADGNILETNTFVERANQAAFSATNVTAQFTIHSQTRKLKYEFSGQDKDGHTGSYDGPKFRNFSLTITRRALTTLEDKQVMTVNSDTTLEGSTDICAIAVADGARAVINIKRGVTLTVTGADASGTTGAAPAIHVPASSTLYIVGEGTLIATGGAAANGGNSANGGDAGILFNFGYELK